MPQAMQITISTRRSASRCSITVMRDSSGSRTDARGRRENSFNPEKRPPRSAASALLRLGLGLGGLGGGGAGHGLGRRLHRARTRGLLRARRARHLVLEVGGGLAELLQGPADGTTEL